MSVRATAGEPRLTVVAGPSAETSARDRLARGCRIARNPGWRREAPRRRARFAAHSAHAARWHLRQAAAPAHGARLVPGPVLPTVPGAPASGPEAPAGPGVAALAPAAGSAAASSRTLTLRKALEISLGSGWKYSAST